MEGVEPGGDAGVSSKPSEGSAVPSETESNNISNHTERDPSPNENDPSPVNNDPAPTDNDPPSADSGPSPTENGAAQITAESEGSQDLSATPQKSNNGLTVVHGNKNAASEKLQRVRKWSISKYKVTRQTLAERMGRGSKTVDLDLEPRMELLKDDRQRYDHMTKLAQTLANQITQLSATQKALGDVFAELSIKSPSLHTPFGLNAEAQRFLSKSGETLSAAIISFTSDMDTLVNKTIEDTMINTKQYEAVRIEYDAYRVDLEELNLGPRNAATVPKLEEAQRSLQEQRERYQRSRDDLSVKLKLLEENKVKVLHNQLWLLHNAVASHCLNCHRFLQNNMIQAQNLSPAEDAPSWLEDS